MTDPAYTTISVNDLENRAWSCAPTIPATGARNWWR